MTDNEPLVSIVVPTYNEEADIEATLEALLALNYPQLEILVVDDSTDATPDIVRRRAGGPLQLLPGPGRGRAAARNIGLRSARGEIVIILNADVRLPRDFVWRILPHYAAGADYVLVEGRILNNEHLLPRYVQAGHLHNYAGSTWINWTEGFSCRREAALAVGLIPEGAPVPLVAGEDGWFGDNLEAAGYRKQFDLTIVVEHVMPEAWAEFWRQRIGRGQGTIQILFMRHGQSLARLFLVCIRQALFALFYSLSLLPPLWYGFQLARRSPHGLRDWIPFGLVRIGELTADAYGHWLGWLELRQAVARPKEA